MRMRVLTLMLLVVMGAAMTSCNLFTKPPNPPSAPTAYDATQIAWDGFRANWSQVADVSEYYLYVSTNSSFSNYVGDYNGLQVTGTSTIVSGLQQGTWYYYRLKARNSDGTSQYSNTSAVQTQFAPLQLTFNNTVFTPITITVNGYGTRVIQPSQNTTYVIPQTDITYTYSASTMGTTDVGSQIGLELIWEDTNNISGSTYTINLVVSSNYFYIYMQNNGAHSLSPLYVNYGTSNQTMDNVMFPANGVKYNVGYYRALSNGVVRAYWTNAPSSYSYWNYGPSLSWTQNQSLTLINNSKTSSKGGSNAVPANGDESKAESFARDIPAGVARNSAPEAPRAN